MNNLKKVLALGLALVMLLGMFTIASAAKDTKKMIASDLTDWDTVEHKDAVSLMVDLGIINGKDDGSFAPTEGIDRASWAKIVYYAATGFEDDATDYINPAKPALNDIGGNWAEGYITFLKTNGLVSGDNYGNFKPNDKVSVSEACKTMLTALGYDAQHRGYQNNANWVSNIMTDARRYGLMDNVDSGNRTGTATLTRENAAEIVYNALQANTVEVGDVDHDGGVEYINGYNKIGTLGYDTFGIIRIEARVYDLDSNGYAKFENPTYPEGISNNIKGSNISGKVKASGTVVGETVSIFVKVKNAKYDEKNGEMTEDMAKKVTLESVVSTTVARGASTADVTYTKGFQWAALTRSGSEYYVAEKFADNCKFYYNGSSYNTSTTQYTEADFKNNIGSKVWDGENPVPGLVVEFYLDDDGYIGIVKAYEYKVAQLTADVETQTKSGVLQVKVPGVFSGWVDADKVTGYQGLLEDDVVLYYDTIPDGKSASSSKTYVIEKADKITGKVTNVSSSGQITVSGTRYSKSALYNNDGETVGAFASFPKKLRDINLNLYLDKSGAVCYIVKAEDAINKDDIALVMEAEWTGSSMKSSDGELTAKLLFMDGTQTTVTVSALDGKTILSENPEDPETEMRGGPDGSAAVTDGANGTAIHELYQSKIGGTDMAFFTFVQDGKNYELTKVVEEDTDDGWDKPATATDTKIQKQIDFSDSNVVDEDSNVMYADNDTIFLVAKNTTNKKADTVYTHYTGFRNVPEMTSADVLAVGTKDNAGTAKFVFLTTSGFSDDVPDGYVFIYNNKWEENGELSTSTKKIYDVNIVDKDGKVTTMPVTSALKDKIYAENMNSGADNAKLLNWTTNPNGYEYVGHFVQITAIDENGIVSALESKGGYENMAHLTKLSGGGVTGGDKIDGKRNTVDYDKVTKFVYVDLSVVQVDPEKDDADLVTLEFAEADSFSPNGFFNATRVAPEGEQEVGSVKTTLASYEYDSVQVLAITADNSTTADYVYVLRVVW